MAKNKKILKNTGPNHFIREWRKYRHLTLEQLAERIELTHGAVSQLERGLVNYTQPTLEAIADALQCSPGDLVMRNPLMDDAVWSLQERLAKATPQQRQKSLALIETFLRDGTNG
jgi:transcriptional regulator with XRE-family HTH domain